MTKTQIATAVALLAAAACSTHTATPASPTNTSAPPPTVGLQPGRHSATADIDLPEGTVPMPVSNQGPHAEFWRYSAPYDDTVTFLRNQFATGRRYDTHGATWWKGLPPCYNTDHQSPPWGWIQYDGFTQWLWSDGAMWLYVEVDKPGAKIGNTTVPFGRIHTNSGTVDPENGMTCLRA
jgi:hypothetical protein